MYAINTYYTCISYSKRKWKSKDQTAHLDYFLRSNKLLWPIRQAEGTQQ